MPGTFKLDHLQPFEPLLSWKNFNFFTFILGGQFLLPQRANMEKWEFIQLQNWMRQRGLSAWCIQTGPFAAFSAHFVLEDFQLFHLHTGRTILITPESQSWEKGVPPTLKLEEKEDFHHLITPNCSSG